MEKTVGIAAERVLPPYATAAVLDLVQEARPGCGSARAAGPGRAVPDLPRRVPGPGDRPVTSCRSTSTTASSARCPRARCCCGAPWLHAGDVDHFVDAGPQERRGAGRRRCAAGNDVVVPQPTCSYVLKKDYVDYVGGPDAELVAEHTYDAAEYLMKVHKGDGTEPRHRVHRRGARGDHLPRALPPAGPEHRAQAAATCMKLTGTKITRGRRVLGASTARGATGSENYEIARKVARKMADAIEKAGNDVDRRRLLPRQRRHPAGDRHAAACTRSRSSPGPTASPRRTVTHDQAHPRRHRRPARLRARARRVPRRASSR